MSSWSRNISVRLPILISDSGEKEQGFFQKLSQSPLLLAPATAEVRLARKALPKHIQSVKTRWPLTALLILLAVALSLEAQRSNLLIIAGQPGSANVIQFDGRN